MVWYIRKNKDLDYEGKRIFEEAEKINLPIKVVVPSTVDIIVTRSDRKSIRVENETVSLPRLVLPRTGSGSTYYTLSVLRHLERLNVPLANTGDAIENAMDKMYSMQILAHHHIPVPRTMLVQFPVDVDLVEDQLGFPCVIKVLSGSYGEGVHLISSREAFNDLMEFVSTLKSPFNFLLQEFIDSKVGEDLRVLVVGGRVIGAMHRKSVDGSFKANITRGGIGTPFPVTDQIAYLATEASKVLGLDIAGVDLLFHGDQFKVCEVNSAPGFEGFEKYCDVNIAKEIAQYCFFRAR